MKDGQTKIVAHNKFSDRTLQEMGIQSEFFKFSDLKDISEEVGYAGETQKMGLVLGKDDSSSFEGSLVNWCDENCAEI